MVVLVTSSSCTPDDTSIEMFLLVTLLMLVFVRSFSCTPDANKVLVKSFSYIPHTDHSEDVLKHFACWMGDNLLLH